MSFDDVLFHNREIKDLFCIFQCPGRMSETMQTVIILFFMPVIKEIIMKKCSSDHLFRPDFQMQLLCQITAEISHGQTVPVDAGHTMLEILVRLLKSGFFFYLF